MVKILIDDEISLNLDNTVEKIYSLKNIFDSNNKPIVINHPMVNIETSKEDDYNIIEPNTFENIYISILEAFNKFEGNVDFILINNLESYIIRQMDKNYYLNHLLKLDTLLANLDDIHTDIFINVSESFYNDLKDTLEPYDN